MYQGLPKSYRYHASFIPTISLQSHAKLMSTH